MCRVIIPLREAHLDDNAINVVAISGRPVDKVLFANFFIEQNDISAYKEKLKKKAEDILMCDVEFVDIDVSRQYNNLLYLVEDCKSMLIKIMEPVSDINKFNDAEISSPINGTDKFCVVELQNLFLNSLRCLMARYLSKQYTYYKDLI